MALHLVKEGLTADAEGLGRPGTIPTAALQTVANGGRLEPVGNVPYQLLELWLGASIK